MKADKTIIISGVSGSGKSTALHAFEDLGYFCVDNLPTPLIGHFVDFLLDIPEEWSAGSLTFGLPRDEHHERRFALLVDCRDAHSVKLVLTGAKRLRAAGADVSLLYFDCSDEVVLRRFQETRRPHPLLVYSESEKTVTEALAKERELLADFREAATHVIDTSSYTPHTLRRLVTDYAGSALKLEVSLLSFGFKFGLPSDADLVLDVRFLPNPYFVSELREQTGLEQAVSDYVFSHEEAHDLLTNYRELLTFLIPRYEKEGKKYLTVAIGCTGGRHRSVAIAEKLGEMLRAEGLPIAVRHRDKERH